MSSEALSNRRATMYLLIGGSAIGLAPIFARLAVTQGGVGSIAAGFWRMCIGAIGFALLGFTQRAKEGRPAFAESIAEVWRIGRKAAVIAGVMFACDLIAWHISFEYTSVANATLLANLSSLMVPLCGVLIFKEVFRKSLAAGGLFAIAGVACLVLFGNAPQGAATSEYKYLGDGLAFLTAFFYTGYMLSTKNLASRLNAGALMLVVSTISAVLLLMTSLYLQTPVLPTAQVGWIWILCLGGFSQIMGQGLVARALTRLPVSQSALMLLAAPVSSAVFGVLILGQNLEPGQMVGVVLTITGIAIIGTRR